MFVIPPKLGQKSIEAQRIFPFRAAHNPEVVGSSPASATTISPGFFKKPGDFLRIWLFLIGKMLALKKGNIRENDFDPCFDP